MTFSSPSSNPSDVAASRTRLRSARVSTRNVGCASSMTGVRANRYPVLAVGRGLGLAQVAEERFGHRQRDTAHHHFGGQLRKVGSEQAVVDVRVQGASCFTLDHEAARRTSTPGEEDHFAQLLAGQKAGTTLKLKERARGIHRDENGRQVRGHALRELDVREDLERELTTAIGVREFETVQRPIFFRGHTEYRCDSGYIGVRN